MFDMKRQAFPYAAVWLPNAPDHLAIGLACVLCLLLWLAWAPASFAQPPAVDEAAEASFQQAILDYNNRSYGKAAAGFEAVANRPAHRLTTAAVYMAGLSYFQFGKYEEALNYFNQIINQYEASRYKDEAVYHKAILMLQDPTKREGGLYLLFNLAETATNQALRQDALSSANHFLFQVFDADFLSNYYPIARQSQKQLVFTALAYRLRQEARYAELETLLGDYIDANGALPHRLVNYLENPAGRGVGSLSHLKVAVLLPLADSNTDTLPPVSQVALEFLAGMRLALDSGLFDNPPSIDLQIFNTRDEMGSLSDLLKTEVLPFKPDLIIGGVYKNSAVEIAVFAEKHQITHIVPFLPSPDLADGRKQVFVFNPAVPVQAEALGHYAAKQLGLKRVLVFDDGSRYSGDYAQAFRDAAKKAGLPVDYVLLNPEPSQAYGQIKLRMNSIKGQDNVGVFMPSRQPDYVLMYLENVTPDSSKNYQVFGLNDWADNNQLNLERLFEARIICPTTSHADSDTAHWPSVRSSYRAYTGGAMTPYAVQGYDLVSFVMHAIANLTQANGLADVLRSAPVFEGLNQRYHFAGQQVNQSVQLVQYNRTKLDLLLRE